MEKKTTEAQRRAIAKYQTEKVEAITFRVQKGFKSILQNHAGVQNSTLSAWIKAAIAEKYEKETGEPLDL